MNLSELQTLCLKVEPALDGILAGQGMDPAVVHGRRPILIEKAGQALADGVRMIEGQVFYRSIEKLQQQGAATQSDGELQALLDVFAGQKFTPEILVVMACTIGRPLELLANRVINEDRLLGLALEGLANAAINDLAISATDSFKKKYCEAGARSCWLCSPGMVGWEREASQKLLFGILQPPPEKIELLPGGQMLPLKSLSGVIGFGQAGAEVPEHCEGCQLRDTCAYQHLHLISK